MCTITVQEIERDLLGFLQRVEAGETFVVCQGKRAVAEVRPVNHQSSELRPFGLCAGTFSVPEDFDAPLPEAVLAEFEGQ